MAPELISEDEDYDFINSQMDPEERAWVALREKAKARQEAIHSGMKVPPLTQEETDNARDIQARMAARLAAAAPTPASMPPATMPAPGATQPAPAGALAVSGMIDLWKVTISEAAIWAPTWKELKAKIKGHKDGVWPVEHFRVVPTAEVILGLFAQDQGWKSPDGAVAESFDVMVNGTMIFRSESD